MLAETIGEIFGLEETEGISAEFLYAANINDSFTSVGDPLHIRI